MITVRPNEFRPEGNLPLADGIEIHELGPVRAALALDRFVEGDGLTTDRVPGTATTEAWGHRQVGNQVHDDHRRRLVAQPPEDRVEVPLVHAHRHSRRDVVRSDRERDQLWTRLDRAADLTKEHIGRGRAAYPEVDHSRVRKHGAQALMQPAHIVAVWARGADTLDRAIAEGNIQDRGGAVRRQGSRTLGTTRGAR